jgi:hypothetical protein
VPIISRSEFLADTQALGRDVIVGEAGWAAVLENNKQTFLSQFVERGRFLDAFPANISPAAFVDTLNSNSGGALSQTERDSASQRAG